MTIKIKILIIVLSVLLTVAIGLGIFYIVSPREFLQFFMSDAKYAAVVVSKNAVSAMDEINALEFTGTISTELEIELLTAEDAKKELNKYVNSLTVSGNAYIDGKNVKGIVDLADKDGSVITAEFISADKKQYVKINQLDLGWQLITKEKSTGGGSTTEGEPVDISKAISVSESKKITLADKTVEGEVIRMSLKVSELKNGIVDKYIPDEYKEKMQSAIKSAASKLSDMGIEVVTAEVYVNEKNEIVAVKAVLDGEANNMQMAVVFGEAESNISVSANMESYGSFSSELVAKKCGFRTFEIPTETTEFDKEELMSAGLSYATTTLVKEHPDFEDAYAAILASVITENADEIVSGVLENVPESVTNIISSITGGATGGTTGEGGFDLSGIIEGFKDVDMSEISGIIEKFASAFGNQAK